MGKGTGMKKTKQGFIVDMGKAAVSMLTGVILAVAAGVMFYKEQWGALFVFLVFAVPYLAAGIWNASEICWDREGVSRKIFGILIKKLSWSEICEIGVMGTKVFNHRNPKKTGRMYIYFSEKAMSDKERFRTMLRWPPLNKMYLLYQADRIDALRRCYEGVIETYNVGDLEL